VQSGKTSKIIQYIKNNYKNFDIIFFIAGTNNLLLSQSIERVEKEFENFSNSLKIINLKSLSKNLTYFLKQHKTYLITLLKGTKQLQTVEKYILEANTTNINILIIDDESDYASVTTYDNEYSTIYKLLNNFTNKPNISYEFISVTATPYANLIDNEKTSPIKYDDVTFFSNNENYFGIEKFMQHPEKFICVDENKYSDIRELEKIIYKSILT
jgi:predicted ATP-grasp superfamily ATP-dependent carboligase